MYSPTIGRFITEDPIGLDGGDSNFYRYVGNDPINRVDPSGLGELWSEDGAYSWVYRSLWIGPRRYVFIGLEENGKICRDVTGKECDKYCVTLLQLLEMTNELGNQLDSWDYQDWDTWFADNGEPDPDYCPTPTEEPEPIEPSSAGCQTCRKPDDFWGDLIILFPNLPCEDGKCTVTSGTRALSDGERQEIIESLNVIKQMYACAVGLVPVLGDITDLISAIQGKDFITGEDLGLLARIAAVAFAVLPFVNATTGRKILELLELIYNKVKAAAKCLGETPAIKKLLERLEEVIAELKRVLKEFYGDEEGSLGFGRGKNNGAPNASGLGNAKRLTADELATGKRLEAKLGKPLSESPHEGAEFIDDCGTTYDALGTPKASQFWNEKDFLDSIAKHLLKSNDFTVIDLTGFTQAQIDAVRKYLATLTQEQRNKIIPIGFSF